MLNPQQVEFIEGHTVTTSDMCKDPHRRVVKRDVVMTVLQELSGHTLSLPVVNQLVRLISYRSDVRLTISSVGSSKKYLLNENGEVYLFISMVMEDFDNLLSEAIEQAIESRNQGIRDIRRYIDGISETEGCGLEG